ncbi:FadR/GntR family transcriptional regulator [Devosia sp.]|uniref:FadR/GntR family transcriptional regulator n=1 Tax=Devosia sp. TaxID=1871048 RepID=UPI001B163772|nr:FCD domain-containing protein [Devosia sp.]MBO9589810.1 FadR family transcriptional regulator [Devosia sp.]
MIAEETMKLQVPLSLGEALPTGAAKVAVDTLGRRIANDIYLPGQVMPTEPELADSLGVSRATIRDAIKVLSGKGLVRTARRYGTRVRPVEEWNLLDADVVTWHDHGHQRLVTMFAETTELRIIIEPAAAELAASRASKDQVESIKQAAHALEASGANKQAMFAADCRFHITILDATGNGMMRQLRPLIVTMLRLSYEIGLDQRATEVVSQDGHSRVAAAISKGQGALARNEMFKMLQLNRRDASAIRQHE